MYWFFYEFNLLRQFNAALYWNKHCMRYEQRCNLFNWFCRDFVNEVVFLLKYFDVRSKPAPYQQSLFSRFSLFFLRPLDFILINHNDKKAIDECNQKTNYKKLWKNMEFDHLLFEFLQLLIIHKYFKKSWTMPIVIFSWLTIPDVLLWIEAQLNNHKGHSVSISLFETVVLNWTSKPIFFVY